MKALLLLSFVFTGYSGLMAQDSAFVTIKTGNSIKDVLTPADIFYYPQFTYGKVFFRDGTKSAGNLNYSRLGDQILFINNKDDTLALANEKTIKFIAIAQDTFYYDEGYVRLISNNGFVKLAEKQVWVEKEVRKMGTHNRPSSTVNIVSLSTYSDETLRAKSHDLIMNEDVLIKKEIQYYFGDRYNHFVLARKNKLMQLFPKEQLTLEKYLDENKVNFDKKDDLEKLAQYLAQRQ